LFRFAAGQVLLWLVEFQEDEQRFSIYRLLRYTTDLMESHPQATVIPAVLFTKKRKWKKDVQRRIGSRLGTQQFLHFQYQCIRLFDFQARDWYHSRNPIVKILMPKMNYIPEERFEVIRQAYQGLFELVKPMMFDKYADFIDAYAEIQEDEREEIYRQITDGEETVMTVMLAQYIKDKGFKEGIQQGIQQGVQQGRYVLLERILTRRFGTLPDWAQQRLKTAPSELLDRWAERVLEAESLQGVLTE
jgi:hypothetical protein